MICKRKLPEDKMSETQREYAANYGKPPAHPASRRASPATRAAGRRKNLSALLVAALNENRSHRRSTEHRRKITKREAIITQMVNKSAEADLRATKMLFDMLRDVEKKAGTGATAEPAH